MYNRGIHTCGTACSNRKHFPQDLATHATVGNRGLYYYRSIGELLAAVWVDKRAIYFLSTIHPAELPADAEPPTVKRRRIDDSQIDVSCPPLYPIISQIKKENKNFRVLLHHIAMALKEKS